MKNEENKLKNICDFYVITHRLKNIIRTGWIVWKVKAERFESVAEHIYGTQMLAFVINSEFDLGLNIEKVSLMLAMHELGETIVGDIPVVDILAKKITKEEKHKMEADAVLKILSPLNDKNRLLEILDEFEKNKTAEAEFAHRVDKLEACFQVKYYEEKDCNDYATPRTGIFEKLRQENTAKGWTTMAKAWIEHDKQHCNFDKLFISLADYLADNKIFED